MKKQILIPLILSIVGLAFIAGGLIAYFVIPIAVKQQLKDTLIINSPSAKGYGGFMDARSGENGGGGRFISYTIFNLTNANAFSKGTEFPNFQAVGPFVYIQRTQKSEVRFLKGGAQVRYKGQATVTYVPSKSSGLDDTIVNLYMVNPFYITAVKVSGGEAQLNIALSAGALGLMLKLLIQMKVGFTTQAVCLAPTPGAATGMLCDLNKFLADNLYSETYSEIIGNNMLAYLTNPVNIGGYYIALSKAVAGNDASLRAIFTGWGATYVLDNAKHIKEYLDQFSTQLVYLGATQGGTSLGLAYQQMSARNFLFVENPLLKNLMANPGNRMFNNESADNIWSYYTAYTGQANDQDTNGQHFSEYANITEITAYPFNYAMDFRVGGIPSFLSSPPVKAGFYYDLIQRTIPTNNAGSDTFLGVPVQIYQVDSVSMGSVDPKYGNNISGFFCLSPVKQGGPLYISQPYYYNVSSRYSSIVTGMTLPSGYNPNSALLVEPVTGMAVKMDLKIQLNLKIDFSTFTYASIANNSKYKGDMMYPVLLMQQNQQMSTSDAANLQKALIDASIVEKAMLGGLLAIGIVLMGAAAMYVIYQKYLTRKQTSDTISETHPIAS